MGDSRPVVLCIEDDDAIWKLMSRRYRDRWGLMRAASDAEACVLLRELQTQVACITTDLSLNGSELSGVELIRLVRGTLPAAETPTWARGVVPRPGLPILVVSGSDELLHHAVQAGATKVLVKPFSLQRLDDELAHATGLPLLRPSPVPFTLPSPA